MTQDPEFDLVQSAARKWRLMRNLGGTGVDINLTRPEADAVQMILDLTVAEAELRSGALTEGGRVVMLHPSDTKPGGTVRPSAYARLTGKTGDPEWVLRMSTWFAWLLIIAFAFSILGWLGKGIAHLLHLVGLV